jgi:ParB family transcriptional regulator, chromosome partitioning protein
MVADLRDNIIEASGISNMTATFANGITEELHLSEIEQSDTPVRSASSDMAKLVESIKMVGLLQPIIVRSKGNHYEIIAGNRRLAACKVLRWRKMPCYIVNIDDQTAFEFSLIENIQRKTMDPLEEAEAFRHYVNNYGWGSAKQLAMKLGKSSSYISKRLALLELPGDVIDKIRTGMLGASVADELSSLDNVEEQSRLALLVSSRRLSMRSMRQLVHESREADRGSERSCNDMLVPEEELSLGESKSDRALSKGAVAIRIALNRISAIMEDIENDWLIYEEFMMVRNVLHSEIDLFLKERKKMRAVSMQRTSRRT